MNAKLSVCLLLVSSIWINLFAPLAAAQNSLPPTEEAVKGLQFSLRENTEKAAVQSVKTPPAAQNLSDAEANAIFERLPPMPVKTDDQADFKMREASLRPPRTGNIIPLKFPADEVRRAPNTPQTIAQTLEIERFAPSGKASFVTDLSVTFSQAMIAVTSQTQAGETVPVKLSPEVKGKWRWLGTNTLIFDAATRFPMATKYTATIPKGTKSANGEILQNDFSWTFETPPPKVETFQPSGEIVRHDAILLAAFNQEINAEAVLQKINVTANNQKIALRIANETEIKSDKITSEKIKQLVPKHWIAFRAADLLPPDAPISVIVETGTPSAEGSLTSISPQNFSFETYGDLKFEKSHCGYNEREKECQSYEDLEIEFNNPIDAQSFDKSLVKIEPKIENAEISFEGSTIEISGGYKKTRATYKVTISAALKDEFGQKLGTDVSAKFKISAEAESLEAESLYDEKQGSDFITLDPSAKRFFSVYSINYPSLKVKLYAVKAEDYGAFNHYKESESKEIPAIGKLISDKVIKIKSKPDAQTETKINISPALTNDLGHAILIVETPPKKDGDEIQRIVVWLEATQIGVDAFADYEQLTVYASDLKSGKPLNNVALQISNGAAGVTGENGLATLELPPKDDERENWLIAGRGADTAILFADNNYQSEKTWSREPQFDSLRWFVFDDRKMYRPGETVSIKGYIRKIAGGKTMDVGELGDAASGLKYILKDSLGNEILKGEADLNVFGAFDFQINLPENINLGYQNLRLMTKSNIENYEFTHSFQVQEFRRPEFEVSAKVESAAPFYVGDSANVSVEAKYYSGGALANAETNWKINAKPTDYTPPNRDDYTFGKFIPWWKDYYENDGDEQTSQDFKGATDTNGKHRVAINFAAANPARPFTVNAEARVQDVNRQTFAASTTLLVHPSELYVGIRTAKTFVAKDETFKVETITTDIDGNAVADAPISIVAELKDWEQVKGEWQEIIVDTQTCQIKSGTDAVSCAFNAKRGGTFTIKASVLDRQQRRNESELEVWVAGAHVEPSRDVEKETVELIPGQEEYTSGQTAEILVNAPFFPAEGVLTLRRNGIVKTEHFTMNESSTVLKIPIEERYLPNLHVQVDLFGAAKRIVFDDETDAKLPKRPAFASGELNLDISTDSRKLNVTAEPVEKTLEPGGETSINIAVKDNNGKPAAQTEVAVVAVDESVLALTNYRIENPLGTFYPQIEAGTTDYYSRENILLGNPEDLGVDLGDIGFGRGRGVGYGNGNGNGDSDFDMMTVKKPLYALRMATNGSRIYSAKENPNQIRIRQNFNALAIFSPSAKTDADGRATVKINLPDNLTRYRITAVAVTKSKQFGLGESALTAKQSLQIRPSAPRFMNFGDRAELPVVLQNQTNNPLTVNVAIRTSNAILTNGNGRKLTIPANDRVEIRFPVTTESAGIARFQIGATSGNLADAAQFEFPVYTPATSEAFATYGTTDANGAIVQPILAPKDVYPQFGGLEVTTSSTQLQELTDAFIYLQSYPFECSEQISSRILSVAALRDVLQAFEAKDLPSKERIEAKMLSDIARLRKLQHSDGGFSFWRSDDESLPYLSVHVAHALARAKQKGYDVPNVLTVNLSSYLKNIENKLPATYSPEAHWAISAYALYVRDLMGDKDAAKAKNLLNGATLEKLSPESIGWILSVLANDKDSVNEVETIKRHLLNRVTETAGAAHFVTRYTDGEYVLLSSDRRADGVILEALLKVRSADLENLLPKIVRGLLANKTQGRWSNTQENAFVLLALDKYFETYEKVTPNFVAKVWLGNTYAGEQTFAGRSTNSKLINVPMNYLQTQSANQNLILDKQGEGRLYYRIGLKYAPKNLNSAAADYGFAVSRQYEALDDAADVKQNADGSWTIKAGARIRVNVQMVAPTRRYHVALVDNLPAGIEIINPELAVSGSNNLTYSDDQSRRSFWYNHQNLRDNRAEAFTSLLWQGVWNYSYSARATTPGTFVVPPAKAEEMYAPETFGHSKTDFVRVE